MQYPVIVPARNCLKNDAGDMRGSQATLSPLEDRPNAPRSGLEASPQTFRQELSTACMLGCPQDTPHAGGRGTFEDTTELEKQIRASLQASSGKVGEKFLPIDQLDQVITLNGVYTELIRVLLGQRSRGELQKLAHDIWDQVKVPKSPSTSRRKLFATLVCINKSACITHFVNENLYDCHLPFHLADDNHQDFYVYREVRQNDDVVRVQSFSKMSWSVVDCESFYKYQWAFLAPYFEVISDGTHQQPCHYIFDDGQVFPFVEEGFGGLNMTSGGYSDVWRVRIHPAHHSHPSVIL